MPMMQDPILCDADGKRLTSYLYGDEFLIAWLVASHRANCRDKNDEFTLLFGRF